MERRYTAAEIRMMASRKQCESGAHRTEELIAAAPLWAFGGAPLEPLYPTTRKFECCNCDAVVTYVYPELGTESDAT